MKKLFALLTVALLLVATLTSCMSQPLDGKTADEALKIVETRMSALESAKTVMDMDMKIAMTGVFSYNIATDLTVSSKKTDTELYMDMAMSMDMGELGSGATNMLYDGGTLYMATDVAGTAVKAKCDVERATLLEKLANAAVGSATTNWSDMTDLKNATIEKKDGKFIITATEMGDAFRNAILGQAGTGDMVDISALTLSEASAVLTLTPDGFCESATVTMKGSVVSSGITMTLDVTSVMTYTTLPADFTVSAPQDADTYTTVTQEEMFGA